MSEASEPTTAAASLGGSTYGELVAILKASQAETAAVVSAIQAQTQTLSGLMNTMIMNQAQQAQQMNDYLDTQGDFIQDVEASLAQSNDLLSQILASVSSPVAPPTNEAVAAVLTIEGDPMPLTIDSVNAQAVLSFTDRDGDPVPPPSGVQSTATSDNTAVLVVGAQAAGQDDNGNPTVVFPLTEVAAGTANLSVTSVGSDGNPVTYTDPSGNTAAIPDPAPVAVTVNPGAPAEEVFTVPGN